MISSRHRSLITNAKKVSAAKSKFKLSHKPGKAKAASSRARPTRYPWEEIEAFFVYGEEATGANGAPIRTQPAVSEMARKFNVPVSTISQRANTKDGNGKDWYTKRNEYLASFKVQRDTRIAEEIVDQEVAFRKTTLSAAQMVVQHAIIQLHRGLRMDSEGKLRSFLDPDALTKLAASARKAQEMGLVAMDRSADSGVGAEGLEDWTLMRRVRAGQNASISLVPNE